MRQEAEILADEIRKKRLEKYGEKCREIPVQVTVEPCTSRAGGGALPEEEIGSFALCVRPGKIEARRMFSCDMVADFARTSHMRSFGPQAKEVVYVCT